MVESDFNYRKFQGVEMRRTDPYGFWVVNLPGLETQSFTTSRQAYAAIADAMKKEPPKEKADKVRK